MKNTIFITGTSTGIGRATALYFAQQGWNVIATMRNPENEKELTSEPNIFVTELDVTNPVSIQAAVQDSIEKFGHLDVLVNNAGFGQVGLFEAVTAEKIRAQFDVNVFGLMEVTRAVLPYFRKRKQGIVINVSSTVGIIPMPMISIYTASKFAVEGFTESLSYELESQHIKVKLVEPGSIKTSFNENSASQIAYDPLLTDYDNFNSEMSKLSGQSQQADNFTAEDAAKVIFKAATDGTHQLRYTAGADAQYLISLRQKPEQEYCSSMRSMFTPDSFKE